MKKLLTITAIIEAATGIGLLAGPSVVAQVLLGAPLDSPASLTVARIAGAALLTIGVACWLARSDTQSGAARGMVSAMVLYNLGAMLVLGAAGIGPQPLGIALWPAVILHAVMTLWCVSRLLAKQSGTLRGP
jgi:hypothetical protein